MYKLEWIYFDILCGVECVTKIWLHLKLWVYIIHGFSFEGIKNCVTFKGGVDFRKGNWMELKL